MKCRSALPLAVCALLALVLVAPGCDENEALLPEDQKFAFGTDVNWSCRDVQNGYTDEIVLRATVFGEDGEISFGEIVDFSTTTGTLDPESATVTEDDFGAAQSILTLYRTSGLEVELTASHAPTGESLTREVDGASPPGGISFFAGAETIVQNSEGEDVRTGVGSTSSLFIDYDADSTAEQQFVVTFTVINICDLAYLDFDLTYNSDVAVADIDPDTSEIRVRLSGIDDDPNEPGTQIDVVKSVVEAPLGPELSQLSVSVRRDDTPATSLSASGANLVTVVFDMIATGEFRLELEGLTLTRLDGRQYTPDLTAVTVATVTVQEPS